MGFTRTPKHRVEVKDLLQRPLRLALGWPGIKGEDVCVESQRVERDREIGRRNCNSPSPTTFFLPNTFLASGISSCSGGDMVEKEGQGRDMERHW